MPDNTKVIFQTEKCEKVPELLFQGIEDNYGIDNVVYKTFKNSPMDFHKKLAQTLVLSGGTTTCENFD